MDDLQIYVEDITEFNHFNDDEEDALQNEELKQKKKIYFLFH